MIKFLLGFVVIILIGLGIYSYMDKSPKVTKQNNIQIVEKDINEKMNSVDNTKTTVENPKKLISKKTDVKMSIGNITDGSPSSEKVLTENSFQMETVEKHGIDATIINSINNPIEYPSLPSEDEIVNMMTEDLNLEFEN